MGRDLLELIPADVLETTFGGEAEPGLELFHFDPNSSSILASRSKLTTVSFARCRAAAKLIWYLTL